MRTEIQELRNHFHKIERYLGRLNTLIEDMNGGLFVKSEIKKLFFEAQDLMITIEGTLNHAELNLTQNPDEISDINDLKVKNLFVDLETPTAKLYLTISSIQQKMKNYDISHSVSADMYQEDENELNSDDMEQTKIREENGAQTFNPVTYLLNLIMELIQSILNPKNTHQEHESDTHENRDNPEMGDNTDVTEKYEDEESLDSTETAEDSSSSLLDQMPELPKEPSDNKSAVQRFHQKTLLTQSYGMLFQSSARAERAMQEKNPSATAPQAPQKA